jgi:hypothetical protein
MICWWKESPGNKVETPIKKQSQSSSKSIPGEINLKISPEVEEWRNMTSGIAQFFDQALPSQLLHRQEVAQCSIFESNDSCTNKRFCTCNDWSMWDLHSNRNGVMLALRGRRD